MKPRYKPVSITIDDVTDEVYSANLRKRERKTVLFSFYKKGFSLVNGVLINNLYLPDHEPSNHTFQGADEF